jgi:putative alpha-1,2-mannosidase
MLIIKADNVSEDNIYIRSVKLNGKNYTRNYFVHNEIFNKGKVVIEFEMSDRPDFSRGTGTADCPPSMSQNN